MCEEVHQLDLAGIDGCDIAKPIFLVNWPTCDSTAFSLTVTDGWNVWQQTDDFKTLGGSAMSTADKVKHSKAALSCYDPKVKYKICRMPQGGLELSWSVP